MPLRGWGQRIQDMLDALEHIERHCSGLSFEEFQADLKSLQAVLYNIAVIGEAAGSLPDDLRLRHPEVPWRDMRNMRNVLIHVYFGVDPKRVWDVATRRVGELRSQLAQVLAEEDRQAGTDAPPCS